MKGTSRKIATDVRSVGTLCVLGAVCLWATGPRAQVGEGAEPKSPNAPPGKSTYTARALLHVAAHQPHVAFPEVAREHETEFELYRRTQAELVKADFVLTSALEHPELHSLPIIRQTRSPVSWLRANLRVEFPGNSQVMEVSLAGDDPNEVTKLLNAVVGAYLEQVVNTERDRRRHRFEDLDKARSEKREQLRRRRNELRSFAQTLGEPRPGDAPLRQQGATEVYLHALREQLQVRSELRRVRAVLKMRQRLLDSGADLKVSESEVDALLQADPVATRLLLPALDLLKVQLSDPKQAEGIPAKLRAVQQQVEARRQRLREQLAQQKRAAAEAEIQRLTEEREALASLCSDLDKNVPKQLVEAAREAVGNSIDMRMMQEEIESLVSVVEELDLTRHKLTVELSAGPRVMLVQMAQPPDRPE